VHIQVSMRLELGDTGWCGPPIAGAPCLQLHCRDSGYEGRL